MNLKKIAGTAMIAGAVGAASLGLGAGSAQADPNWVDPNIPWIPGPADWVPGHWDPGLNWGPPGQVKKWCPWHSPPGHWIGGPHGIPCSNIFSFPVSNTMAAFAFGKAAIPVL